MSNLIIYEAGVRDPDGIYRKFMESPDRDAVDDYLEIMNGVVDECMEVVFLEKEYVLISTTPHITKM